MREEDKADAADAIDDEVEVQGEAVFTSTTAVSNLDGARLLKEQTIAKNQRQHFWKSSIMRTCLRQPKQEAIDSMLTMTQTAQKETDAQMLLEAKGYADTVVSINNGAVDVMVNAVSLTDAQTAPDHGYCAEKNRCFCRETLLSQYQEPHHKS